MQKVVSITSQGQLTIPQSLRKDLGINRATKAVLEKIGDAILVRPRRDFWSLAGSLKSEVKLSDSQLKKARKSFSESWGKNA